MGSPETFSKKTGKIRWAPYIKDWVGIDLKAYFENKFKVDVILKDHVKLETLGEQWQSFNNISNMIYLVITKGIGAGGAANPWDQHGDLEKGHRAMGRQVDQPIAALITDL